MWEVLNTSTRAPRPFFRHTHMHRNRAATAPVRNTTPNTMPEMAICFISAVTHTGMMCAWRHLCTFPDSTKWERSPAF
ncbi:hypothetical protein EYF80_049461 [Liparis tanakae]|uniref:Uncharacterized protein n=1 Tax=Liparis tanakae TaxID=230148 RepID=A0A4Z2FJC4_9TELE|nr:hypothetical protein EYF80_049461 [Liparis tanakae]